MKTIREWLSALPEPYKTQALANTEDGHTLDLETGDVAEAISAAFIWDKTPEGYSYWAELNDRIYDKELILPLGAVPSPTNALSALRAIALKERLPVENISAVRPINDKGEWEYQLINSGEHFFINLPKHVNRPAQQPVGPVWVKASERPADEVHVFLYFPDNGNMNSGYFDHEEDCWYWRSFGELEAQEKREYNLLWAYPPESASAPQVFTPEQVERLEKENEALRENIKGLQSNLAAYRRHEDTKDDIRDWNT